VDNQYEVLNPWGDADPVPLQGITPRPTDLEGKTIGLFAGHKRASRPILTEIEKLLKESFPTSTFSLFQCNENIEVTESAEKDKFEEWLKGVHAVVCAVGD
jgi:hypothetical protein